MSPQTLAPAPLASCEFQYKIIFKMEIYVILSLISIFSRFFFVFNHDVSYTLILPVSQLQKQQLMTSQIRSHIEYLIQTYDIFVLI